MCPNNEFTVTRRSLLAFLMPQWHSMTFLITPMFLTGLCVTGWSLLANHMVSFISNEIKKVQIKNSKQILEQYKHNKIIYIIVIIIVIVLFVICFIYMDRWKNRQTDRQMDGWTVIAICCGWSWPSLIGRLVKVTSGIWPDISWNPSLHSVYRWDHELLLLMKLLYNSARRSREVLRQVKVKQN